MSGTGTNPMIAQGTLNRIRTHLVFASFPSLNIGPQNMGKGFARVSLSGPFVQQEPTATGIVNSPEPYVMGTITVEILRTQSLAAAWRAQIEQTSIIGTVDAHADTSAFPKFTLYDVSVTDYDPGAYDGMNPVFSLTLRGVYYPNNNLWQAL